MNYSKIYIELMERSFNRSLESYSERHHIVPRCMGGGNEASNIAVLTPEEHFLAHQLLVKIYPNNKKLAYSLGVMCSHQNGKRVNNKLFGWLRRKFIEAHKGKIISEEHREKLSKSGKGREVKPETREKIGFAQRGEKNHNYGKTATKETRNKMSLSRSRAVIQYSKDGEFIAEYQSQIEAMDKTGIDSSAISKCCKKVPRYKSAGGFFWSYAELT